MVMTRATAADDTDRSVTDDAADTHESSANDAAGSATDGAAGGATDGAVAESGEVKGSDVRAAILGYSTKYGPFGKRQGAYRNIWRSARQNTLHIEEGAFARPISSRKPCAAGRRLFAKGVLEAGRAVAIKLIAMSGGGAGSATSPASSREVPA
jgi:hypothetical protein